MPPEPRLKTCGSNGRTSPHVPTFVKRPFAILALTLTLSAGAFAGDPELAHAIAQWRDLFRPLASAQGADLFERIEKVVREHPVRYGAVQKEFHLHAPGHAEREGEATEGNLGELRTAYARANPAERRQLARLAAILGDPFEGRDAPQYAICTKGPGIDAPARELFDTWVRKTPNAHLGLLDDPDPRVADAAVRALGEAHADAVITHLQAWQQSPKPRFRGIVAQWSRLLGEAESVAALRRLLDDPSDNVRDAAVRELPYSDTKREYEARHGRFDKATWGERRTILLLAHRTQAVEFPKFALACLEAPRPNVRQTGLECLRYYFEPLPVPLPTLARLRKDPLPLVRSIAYELSERQAIPMRELQAGLNDPEESVRSSAIQACAKGVENLAEFRALLPRCLKQDHELDLSSAVRRLGDAVSDDLLTLLASDSPGARKAGIGLAIVLKSPRMIVALEGLLGDPDAQVRRRLAWEAQNLEGPTRLRILQALAKDADPDVREQALERLKELD